MQWRPMLAGFKTPCQPFHGLITDLNKKLLGYATKNVTATVGLVEKLSHAKSFVSRFYEPALTTNPDSPFVRDASNKVVRRSYWTDMPDSTLVMVMTQGIGANLTNDEKRGHLIDLKRERLIDQVCTQEILPPEK